MPVGPGIIAGAVLGSLAVVAFIVICVMCNQFTTIFDDKEGANPPKKPGNKKKQKQKPPRK